MKKLALLVAVLGILGCGESDTSPTNNDPYSLTQVDKATNLNVNVRVSASRVKPGDSVDMSATVNSVRAEAVRFSWVNVTGHGQLLGAESGSVTGPFAIRWQSPPELSPGTVQVEVIQLVVTAISQVVSVTDKGVLTSHDIATQTKTIPITITTAP